MEEQIFYPLKKGANYFAVIFYIFFLISWVYIFFLGNNPYQVFEILGGFTSTIIILVIGYLFFSLIKELRKIFAKTKDGIYLTSQGVTIKILYITHFIEWQNIKSFNSLEIMNRPVIAIYLFDNDRFLQNLKPLLKKMSKASIKKYGTPISILVNLFNVSKVELLSELNYRLDKYGR